MIEPLETLNNRFNPTVTHTSDLSEGARITCLVLGVGHILSAMVGTELGKGSAALNNAVALTGASLSIGAFSQKSGYVFLPAIFAMGYLSYSKGNALYKWKFIAI